MKAKYDRATNCGECGVALRPKVPRKQRYCSPACAHRARSRRAAIGGSTHPLWNTYAHMIGRCTNEQQWDWKHYGGRGITVCHRWLDDFGAFVADMGERPEGLTLDRIDNDGNYEPGNCRWATRSEQASNRRPVKIADTCKRGHPRNDANLLVRANGGRVCRPCRDEYRRAHPYLYSGECVLCGATFQTPNRGVRTCSRSCRSILGQRTRREVVAA